MDSRREPFRVGNKHYLPYMVDYIIDEGYTRCAVCDEFLQEESFRIGMFVANKSILKSYHSNCFWQTMKQGNNAITLDLVKGIDQIEYEDQEMFLENMKEYNRSYVKAEGVARNIFEMKDHPAVKNPEFVLILPRLKICSLVPNSNLECVQCKKQVDDDDLYFTMKTDSKILFHIKCALSIPSVIIGTVEDCGNFNTLTPPEQRTIKQRISKRRTLLKSLPKISPQLLYEFGSEKKRVIFLSTMELFFREEGAIRMCRFCEKFLDNEEELCTNYKTKPCHPICLFKACSIIFETPASMMGYEDLPIEYQSLLQRQFDFVTQENVTVMSLGQRTVRRKRRAPEEEEQVEHPRTTELRKNQLRWTTLLLKKFGGSPFMAHEILEQNGQSLRDIDFVRDVEWLVDIMMFGPPLRCPYCKSHTIFYFSDTRQYGCTNFRSNFTKCTYKSKNPRRGVFVMPDAYEYLLEGLVGFQTNMFTERLYAGEAPEVPNLDTHRDLSHIKPIPKEMWTEKNTLDERYSSSVSNASRKYAIKNGTSVPVQSFTKFCDDQILVDNGITYQVLLSKVDVQNNVNLLLELYILECDFESKFTIVKAESRTGTSFRDATYWRALNKTEAIKIFEDMFSKTTQMKWANRYELGGVSNGAAFHVNRFNDKVNRSGKTKMLQSLRCVLHHIVTVPDRLNARMVSVNSSDPIFGQIAQNTKTAALKVLDELRLKVEQNTATSWDYLDATNAFYTMVPTYSGFESHQLLDTKEKIDEAYERFQTSSGEPYEKVNFYEEAYKSLNMNMKLVPMNSEERVQIKTYLNNTTGITHDVSVQLLNIFELERPDLPRAPIAENTMLLWHGTTMANLQSIMQNGLQKPQPEHVGNGKMFGYGIYFADTFSKSVMYSKDGEIRYVLLCEVATGKMYESMVSMSQQKIDEVLENGHDSVKGVGKYVPIAHKNLKLQDGLVMPLGKLQETPNFTGRLLYNEYIIYDETRVRLKYLCQLKVDRAAYRT